MAQALNTATFLEWFPEFRNINPQAIIDRTIMFNSRIYPERVWGEDWHMAVALVTAHQLALRYDISATLEEDGLNDPVGSMSSTTAGMSASSNGLSENFAVSQLTTGADADDAYWSRTEYGMQFLMLMLRLPVSGVVCSPDTSDTMLR